MGIVRVILHPRRDGQLQTVRNNLLYEVRGSRYTLLYTVITDNNFNGPVEIFNSPLLPSIGDPYQVIDKNAVVHEQDFAATCVSIEPMPTESQNVWHVLYTYDSERLLAIATDNPLAQPPDISWEVEQDERAETRDAYGVQHQSSSLNPFDPPLMQRFGKSILRITRNEATFNESFARTFWNKINAFPFAGYAQGYAKVNFITGRSALVNGVFHYQVNYEIAFHPYGWFDYILDADFRDVDKKPFTLNGQPLANASMLNGRGRSLDVFETFHCTANSFIAAAVSFDLDQWEAAVNMPLGVNNLESIPGIPLATMTRGPHNYFQIKVMLDTAGDQEHRVELSNRNDQVFPNRKPNENQDLVNPKLRPNKNVEVMTVTNVVTVPFGATFITTLTVLRGQAGTIALDWQALGPKIRIWMLPYYRFYTPNKFIDISKLGLPIV